MHITIYIYIYNFILCNFCYLRSLQETIYHINQEVPVPLLLWEFVLHILKFMRGPHSKQIVSSFISLSDQLMSHAFLCATQTTTVIQINVCKQYIYSLLAPSLGELLNLCKNDKCELEMASASCLHPHTVVNMMPMPSLTHHTMSLSKHLSSVRRGAHPINELVNGVHSYLNIYV